MSDSRLGPFCNAVRVTESSVVPLEPWGETARRSFWPLLFLFGPVLGIPDWVGLIDRTDGFWLVLSIVLAVAWAVTAALWAVAAYRRRRATNQLSE